MFCIKEDAVYAVDRSDLEGVIPNICDDILFPLAIIVKYFARIIIPQYISIYVSCL